MLGRVLYASYEMMLPLLASQSDEEICGTRIELLLQQISTSTPRAIYFFFDRHNKNDDKQLRAEF